MVHERTRIALTVACLACFGLVALSAGNSPDDSSWAANTETIVVQASADAYVSEASPTTNRGTSSSLRIDGSPTVYRTYLRFDLPELPGEIISSQLVITPKSSTKQPVTLTVVSDSSWNEKTITWANAPALDKEISSISPIVSTSPVSWDVPIDPQARSVAFSLNTAGATMVNFRMSPRDFICRPCNWKCPWHRVNPSPQIPRPTIQVPLRQILPRTNQRQGRSRQPTTFSLHSRFGRPSITPGSPRHGVREA